ncbi:MAG: hypothetical protein RDU89_10035 [bacterium]|nr:hypothetical protein [bacterium]
MAEWSREYFDERDPACVLPPLTWRDRRFIERLREQGKLEIRELRAGMEIETWSHVGYVPFEHFALRIDPRLPHPDMLRMMQYAYGVDDLTLYERSGVAGISRLAAEDLVVAGLVRHVSGLVRQGLFQSYVEEEAELATVRGSIRFAGVATSPRVGATLPCRYERRTTDVLVNQLVTGALALARRLTRNRFLLRELGTLQTFLEECATPITLTESAFRTAYRSLTRLNQHYRPALDLCYLLHQEASLDRSDGHTCHFPGFLLNMSHLFERFIGRLLEDVVPDGHRVAKQICLSFYTAPPGQPTPRMRPDFRVLDSEGRVIAIVDAKYKFLDRRSTDVGDLYQLTIYGLADNPSKGRVIALYPGSPSAQLHSSGDDRVYGFEGPNGRRMDVVFRRVRLGDCLECPEFAGRKGGTLQ